MGELNDAQRRAATCGTGPHLVLAGPGTGKTTTLTARFAHLVSEGVDPSRILAVTFTRKAGDEMRDRLIRQLGPVARGCHVGTFHSLAARLLRPYADHVGLTSRFRILDERGQRGILAGLGIFWNPENGGELTDIIGGAKSRMLTPEDFRREVEEEHKAGRIRAGDPVLEAVDHYHDYQQALKAQDACDFEDLIMYTVRLLEGYEGPRRDIAGRFDHVLVDEFQDINIGQFRMLRGLLLGHQNLWCVGDDDQSIYAFRGAQSDFCLNFDKQFPGAGIRRLSDNYRSTPEILNLASVLVSFNTRRYAKSPSAVKDSGPPVVVQDHPHVWAEAEWTVQAVKKVLEKGIPGREIAVLFRVGQQAFPMQKAFGAAGVNHVLRGAGDFWQMAPVRYLRGMLLLAEHGRGGGGLRLMGPGKRAQQFTKQALTITATDYPTRLRRVRDMLLEKPPQYYGPAKEIDYAQRLSAAAEAAGAFPTARALEDWVHQQAEAQKRPDRDAVVLSTIHSAKGLEWHTVFLAGFEERMLPHELAEGSEEEERRLAYVALTRAKRFLCLSFCDQRFDEVTGPSPFLEDLLREAPEACYKWRGEGPLPGRDPDRRARITASLVNAEPVPYTPSRTKARPKKEGPANNGLAWTRGEERRLLRWWQQGKTLEEIAAKLERGKASVKRRLDRLAETASELPADDTDHGRDKLMEAAHQLLDYDTATVWLHQPLAGGQTPWHLAKTEKGLRKALTALKKFAASES